MGFREITVIWDGALSEERTFEDTPDDAAAMSEFIAHVQADVAHSTPEMQAVMEVAIYSVYHDHSEDLAECNCVQFVTDHHPLWTNRADLHPGA